MLKNRGGFTVSRCQLVDTITSCTIRHNYICIEMTLFLSDRNLLPNYRIVRYILLSRYIPLKNTPQIHQIIDSIFEVYFYWSSKTRPCLFQYRAKYTSKIHHLWYFRAGLSPQIAVYNFSCMLTS